MALAVPMLAAAGPLLWWWHPSDAMLWVPVLLLYGGGALLDSLLGADRSNPPEWAVPALEADPYYRRITWALVPLLPAAFRANFQLTSANDVEHYGLLRRPGPDGRPERCQPCRSWNSNHLFSNWATFHLQRHADHHAHPTRRYPSLRHFDDAPQLPSGYFAIFPLACVPPLWFRVMDPRLVQAVGGDASRVNFDPGRRAALMSGFSRAG